MKIEKINDNQIRCTLTKEDLADRQIKLSELAYGSEKAKSLFRDMMQQANNEFGFEANDIPLMVEAIPVSAESIILVITKVEYPEELDTRFSKFSEEDEDWENEAGAAEMPQQGADDILGWFKRIREEREAQKKAEEKENQTETPEKKQERVETITDLTKMFEFSSLDEVTRIAHVLSGYYDGKNDLYRDRQGHRFLLMVHKSNHSPEEFNKVCNMISEYGTQKAYTQAYEAHWKEHKAVLVENRALQTLAQI